MKIQYLKLSLEILASALLFFVGACSNNNQLTNSANNQETTNLTTNSPSSTHGATKGGQVVETGDYHLEFVPEKEANQTHIDLYLQTGDTHTVVPDSKVTAQVQLPDGTAKTIPFTYSPKDKHYTALLKENKTGQYQVKISAEIKGKKVDGRFSFNR